MNLSQLYYFQKLAEVQHYTKAAKELYISQPALSEAIASLEKELGVTLFCKTGRNIELTKYGALFYTHVQKALLELGRGIQEVRERGGSDGGMIDIACIPTRAGDYLPKILSDYQQQHSTVQFHIYTGPTFHIIEGIKTQQYDIGFCSLVEGEKHLEFIPVLAEELILIVNENHPLAKRSFLQLADLKEYVVVTYRDSLPIGRTISKYLSQRKVPANYLYDDEISIAGYVALNPVAGIVARTPSLQQFDYLHSISLDFPADARLVYLVYHKKHYHGPAVAAFISYVTSRKYSKSVQEVIEKERD